MNDKISCWYKHVYEQFGHFLCRLGTQRPNARTQSRRYFMVTVFSGNVATVIADETTEAEMALSVMNYRRGGVMCLNYGPWHNNYVIRHCLPTGL